MKKKNKKIVILGKSLKFKKIISSIFPQSDIKVFPWRSIKKLKLDEKEDMIDYENNDFRNDLKTKLLKTLVKECKKIKEK